MQPDAFRQMKHRILSSPDEDAQWLKAVGNISTDGVYALATFENRPPRAYQIMTREQFLACAPVHLALHAVAWKILCRKIQNKKVSGETFQSEYDKVCDELLRLNPRLRFNAVWYLMGEPGVLTEAAVSQQAAD